MLKIILPSVSLLLLSSSSSMSWFQLMSVVGIMTFVFSTFMYSPLLNKSCISLYFYIDTLSAPLILLTLWVSFLMIMASTSVLYMNKSQKWFVVTILSLMLILTLTFSSSNLLMFYVMFEASLIPTLILILGWGYQPERLQAGMYMMMYTITASLPLLISLMLMYLFYGSLSTLSFMWPIPPCMWPVMPLWWVITITAFMVKVPLYTTHLWLPKAHVEAPVAGSMILAGILLKLGGYGLLRLSFMYPSVNILTSSMFSSIALWGACATGLICIRQTDLKSLIAYSSVGHMALLVAGVCSNSMWGWSGALVLMIAHGLCSSALFAIANITYEYSHTRSMYMTKGILSISPYLAMLFFILCAANMAAPPFINLAGEIMLITSSLFLSSYTALYIGFTSFLAAAYSLYLYTSTNHGQTPTFMNSITSLSSLNISMIMLHLIPLISLIMSLLFISEWL
nr:NADH dehydrogenase subunit 4 [Microphthalmus similis]